MRVVKGLRRQPGVVLSWDPFHNLVTCEWRGTSGWQKEARETTFPA